MGEVEEASPAVPTRPGQSQGDSEAVWLWAGGRRRQGRAARPALGGGSVPRAAPSACPSRPRGTCCRRNGRAAAAADPPSPQLGLPGSPFTLARSRRGPAFRFFSGGIKKKVIIKTTKQSPPLRRETGARSRHVPLPGAEARPRGPGRRRRPTWRRAGLGRAAAAPERPTAPPRLAAPTPAPNLARRLRSSRGRSAGACPGAEAART